MQMNIRMRNQEGLDPRGLVRREIVSDHVNLLTFWLVDYDVGQERNEFGRGMPHRGLTEHLAGFGIEGCVQRQRAMPVILEAVAFGTARREGQNRGPDTRGSTPRP